MTPSLFRLASCEPRFHQASKAARGRMFLREKLRFDSRQRGGRSAIAKAKTGRSIVSPRSLSPGVSEGENNRITVETIWKEKVKKEKSGLEPNGHSLKIKGFVIVLKSVPPVDTFPPQFERV